LKDLITSYEQVVERKGIDAHVEASYQKFLFASNHETSFMKVGSETTRFFVMKVRPIKKMVVDFEQKLFLEIPYVMYFLTKRGVLTPKQDRLWFAPELLLNEALIKLRQESKDIVQQVIEDLISTIFIRTEYEKPILRLSSNQLRSLMIAFAGKTYEKPPKYFQKVACESMRTPYIDMPIKQETIYIPAADAFKDLSTLESWEYEPRRIAARYLLFPIWRYLSPSAFVDNYAPGRVKKMMENIETGWDEIEKNFEVQEVRAWMDGVVKMMKTELVTEKMPF